MQVTAILLRWYRSFNISSLGPVDPIPPEIWNRFDGESFPFIRVPLDRLITTVVGANESGKSHLLSAIAKVINGIGMPGSVPDRYEIKDICRYCGFGGLDDRVWPEIGIEFSVEPHEAKRLKLTGNRKVGGNGSSGDGRVLFTVILNGRDPKKFATIYHENEEVRVLNEQGWDDFAVATLPEVEILNSELALPNEVHVDELIDLYKKAKPKPVIDPLGVQSLWREIEPINVVQDQPIDAANHQVRLLPTKLSTSVITGAGSRGIPSA
jgi:uncharacterized protein YhaN